MDAATITRKDLIHQLEKVREEDRVEEDKELLKAATPDTNQDQERQSRELAAGLCLPEMRMCLAEKKELRGGRHPSSLARVIT